MSLHQRLRDEEGQSRGQYGEEVVVVVSVSMQMREREAGRALGSDPLTIENPTDFYFQYNGELRRKILK